MRLALLALCLAACTDEGGGEGTSWFTAHITSTMAFDTATVSAGSLGPQTYMVGAPVTEWPFYSGVSFYLVPSMTVTIEREGNAIATASVLEIPYHTNDDGSMFAEFTLAVNP